MSVPDSGEIPKPKRKFCVPCGSENREHDRYCSKCGFDFASLPGGLHLLPPKPRSAKSFGVAAVLCGVFGILGIHHFYLGNLLHGLLDLGMAVLALSLFAQGGAWDGTAFLILGIDILHSFIVMIQLFVGSAKDGKGLVVPYPGQMNY